jgi:hypothetical protein
LFPTAERPALEPRRHPQPQTRPGDNDGSG